MKRLFWEWYWRRKINYRLKHGLCIVCGARAFPLLNRCVPCLDEMLRERGL